LKYTFNAEHFIYDASFGRNSKEEDGLTLSTAKMQPSDSTFRQYKVQADIREGSSKRGVKRNGGGLEVLSVQ